MRDGNVWRELQVGAFESREREEPREIERRGQRVHLLAVDVELAHEQIERRGVHVARDLEANGRAEAAAQQLFLERLDEVLGLVFLDLDVFVTRDAEDVVVDDLHAGEEPVELVRQQFFERDESHVICALACVDAHVPRNHLRHLEARELGLVAARVAHADRDVERATRDVREGVGRVDGERHEHGVDVLFVILGEHVPVGVVELAPLHDAHTCPGELRLHLLVPAGGVAQLQLVGGAVDV